jgi:hypothetical protein
MKGKVLITGGTGLIGSRLTEILLQNGFEVSYLSRKKEDGKIKKYQWDIHKKTVDEEALTNADYIINLAGANVFEKKWNKEFKKEILESRTESVQLIYDTLKVIPHHVKAFISASAIGYYGLDTGEEWVNENAPGGDDFLAEVVENWEQAIKKIESLSIRTAIFRIGIVMSNKGGALEKLIGPIKKNAGAVIGSGKQYVSWVHIDDVCYMFLKALEDESVKGVYNATAPTPVTNHDLTHEAAKTVGKSIVLPNVPAFALKLMLGSEKASIVLGGNRVSSEKIAKTGYNFHYKELKSALQNLLKT